MPRPLADGSLAYVAAGVGGIALAWWLVRGSASRPAPLIGTGFDDYLRRKVDNSSLGCAEEATENKKKAARFATRFESYLKSDVGEALGSTLASKAGTATAEASCSSERPSCSSTALPPSATPVLVLYGTEFGFSREVAESACAALRDSGLWPVLSDMASFPSGLPSLASHQAIIVACSTQGDGVPPSEAHRFCDWLSSAAAPRLDGVAFSVCAMGDRSYANFCRCGRELDARLEALGASRAFSRADIDKEDWTAVREWVAGATAALCVLPLKTAAALGGALCQGGPAVVADGKEGIEARPRVCRSRPCVGTVVAVTGLCKVESEEDKNTVLVEIDIACSGLSFAPGDALGVWPRNPPDGVHRMLRTLGSDPGLLVKTPSWHYADPLGEERTSMPLREMLETCYDIRSPKQDLLRLLLNRLSASALASSDGGGCRAATPAVSAPRAAVLTDSANDLVSAAASTACLKSEDAKDADDTKHPWVEGCIAEKIHALKALVADSRATERYLAPRHVADVLKDFHVAGAAPDVVDVLGTLRQLQPRLYSISSSALENPDRVQITVAMVNYSSLGLPRVGVASTQLGVRVTAGDRLPVYVHANPDFKLPANPGTPIVMVGPGTGLAPFRAFVQERLLADAGKKGELGPAMLFFGCRRPDRDFIYGDLLKKWDDEGVVSLFTAFSRLPGQRKKVYVQDCLRERADEVWALLQAGGHFYVCGDAKGMAPAVDAALVEIAAARLEGGKAAGEEYVRRMGGEGRYHRDTWY